jgi:hypothetical protein
MQGRSCHEGSENSTAYEAEIMEEEKKCFVTKRDIEIKENL